MGGDVTSSDMLGPETLAVTVRPFWYIAMHEAMASASTRSSHSWPIRRSATRKNDAISPGSTGSPGP